MTQYDNNNTGALFKNDKKTAEAQPDYTGNAEVNNEKFRLACWIKTSKAGRKFFKIEFTPEGADFKKSKTKVAVELDDNIPFD